MSNFWFALSLTTLAGLFTGIGSLIALFAKRENFKFLALMLSFSAGVMIFVSFIALAPQSIKMLEPYYGENLALIIMLSGFFLGVLLTMVIDWLIPHEKNHKENESKEKSLTKLFRAGLFTAGAMALHNFPEGLSTFISGLSGADIAYPVFIAIALHNIPEGIAVSIPIFYATGSRKKAFFYSFSSGLIEPIGAIMGYFLLFPFITESLMGTVFAIVAGIMVYISFKELIPTAVKYGKQKIVIAGVFSGMALMGCCFMIG